MFIKSQMTPVKLHGEWEPFGGRFGAHALPIAAALQRAR